MTVPSEGSSGTKRNVVVLGPTRQALAGTARGVDRGSNGAYLTTSPLEGDLSDGQAAPALRASTCAILAADRAGDFQEATGPQPSHNRIPLPRGAQTTDDVQTAAVAGRTGN